MTYENLLKSQDLVFPKKTKVIRAHFSHRPYHTLDVGSGHISDGRLLIRAKVDFQVVQAYSLTWILACLHKGV